ncbi:hypothetical protein CPB84DRAFT_872884 [Gymnopilus junonius]|uniref:ZZ-type domain-containing protein n=1 Tax=Gymnopilus junonius TaxID=109634 RepID=A0A9P5TN40_GYMJU|nr:hypothetical protein CPB84DRAFT_872884 [Gymnopilus junonius]
MPRLQPAVHNAFCNLCEAKIFGERYKCTNCPNFDACTSCFSNLGEKHPGHTFVRVHQQIDYIAKYPPRSMHHATCDNCKKGIIGPRFKCKHPDCPDYDLCEDCEALPIPVHPNTHPLLKMKIPTLHSSSQPPLEEKDTEMEDGSDSTLSTITIRPPDYDAFEFATSAAWPRAVSVILSSQDARDMIKQRQEELMQRWTQARGDNLPSDAYDYLTYSHGIAWPKAIVESTSEANFLLIRRRFLDIMAVSGANL